MRSVLVKTLLEVAEKPHSLLLLSVKRAPQRSSFPSPSSNAVEDMLCFVFKTKWPEVHTMHCVESVCAVSRMEGSVSQSLTSLCNYITDSAVALNISTSCYEKVIPLATEQRLFLQSTTMLQQVLSRGTSLSATLENCLLEISSDKPQPLLDAIQQIQSFRNKPGRPLFRRALKLCLHHQDQEKMAPIIAKLIVCMRECYSKEEVESDVYCCALDSASHAEQFECIWHDIVKSGLSKSSLSLVQSYLKGSAKLYNTDTAKMLKHLSVILKAHTVNGVNLAVETLADMSPSVEQNMHDTLAMNIFQSILLVHGIALSVKSYQYLVEQLLGVAFNPIRRSWGTRICYHLLGGLLHTYDHMPPVLLLVETSKPLVIANGLEGFLQMFRLTKDADGNKQLNSDFHWTKGTSSYLLKLAWNSDMQLGIKVMGEMLNLGLMPSSYSVLRLIQHKSPGKIKGVEYELLKCMVQLNGNPLQQKQLLLNTLSSLLYRICVKDQPPKRIPAVSRQVLSMASNKLLQNAQPTHEHCIQKLHALL